MIACPSCGADSAVYETRATPGGARRRRVCKDAACGQKFSTIELPLGVPTRDATQDHVVAVPKAYLDKMLELLSAALGFPRA